MGFSPLGLIMSVGVLAPNLLLIWFRPGTPVPSVSAAAPVRWLERAGQVLCVVVPAITAPGLVVWWWLVPAAVALVWYYALWGRYLAMGRLTAALYRPSGGLPVPMAILPVITFLAGSAWLNNLWIAVAALVLAIGHIPTAVLIARAVDTTDATPS